MSHVKDALRTRIDWSRGKSSCKIAWNSSLVGDFYGATGSRGLSSEDVDQEEMVMVVSGALCLHLVSTRGAGTEGEVRDDVIMEKILCPKKSIYRGDEGKGYQKSMGKMRRNECF